MALFTQLHQPGDPTLVMLHGTGGDEREMFELGRSLNARTGVAALRGKEPENGVNRWFRRFAEGVFDEENLKMRANELADAMVDEYAGVRRFAVGFSNGANIAAAILLLRPEAFDGAVLLAPMVPFQPESLLALDAKPVLMICGENDPIVPRANALHLATMLQTAGADLEVVWHKGGHGLGATEWNIVRAWIATRI
jgi:phospholipase/carboxylesterase